MSFTKSKVGLLVYWLVAAFIYLIGYLFNLEYLIFQKENRLKDGSLLEATGSVLPFLLALPVYWLLRKNKKGTVKQ